MHWKGGEPTIAAALRGPGYNAPSNRRVAPDPPQLACTETDAARWWRLFAQHLAGRPSMRVSPGKGRERGKYPASSQRPISNELPTRPAAVMLWDRTGRLPVLALDFDAKPGPGNGDRRAAVARDAADAIGLLRDCGMLPIADVGPTGGQHVYVRLPSPAAEWEVRQVAAALSARWATLDTAPLLNPVHGCIRPPGSRHSTGGFQRLITSEDDAAAALDGKPREDSWRVLRTRIGADTIAAEQIQPADDPEPPAGVRRRPIAADAEVLARTGQHPRRGFASPSEARYSVVCHAVNAGWPLAELAAAVEDGSWPWLADSYRSKGRNWRGALTRDYRKSVSTRAARNFHRPVRLSDTSQPDTHGGALLPPVDPHLALRKFFSLTQDIARRRRLTPTQRSVLSSAVWAGHVLGRIHINIGTRGLGEQAGASAETVSTTLRDLALLRLDDCSPPLLTRTARARGQAADVWRLNVELAHDYRPARGRRVGLRPVFRVLGGHLSGEVYELLGRTRKPLSVAEISSETGFDRRRVDEAVKLLAGWDLARAGHGPGTWVQGPADPDRLSRQLGGEDDLADQRRRHRHQRAKWHDWLAERLQPVADPYQAVLLEWDLAIPEDENWIREMASGTAPPYLPATARSAGTAS